MPAALRTYDRFRFLYRAWRYRRHVEAAEIRFLTQHVTAGDTCLDIGGHKGAFSYWMQRLVGPSGKVYTFEPQPELVSYLQSVQRSFHWQNVTIVHAAVSSSAGECQLFRSSDSPSPSATVELRHESGSLLTVPMLTLDQYFADKHEKCIRFIKCDVEGHELEVFRGAEATLQRHRPTLLFECEQRHQEKHSIEQVFQYLTSLGYSGHFFQKRQLHPLDDLESLQQSHGEEGYVYNFVFLPSEEAATRRSSQPSDVKRERRVA